MQKDRPQTDLALIEKIRALRPIDRYANHKCGVTEQEFRQRCEGQAIWHSVDLGDVFIEGARKNLTVTEREMSIIGLPILTDRTVLDVGAFGGWFSFEADRRGAKSVTAIDYYSWAYDWPKIHAWVRSEREAGRTPDTYAPPDWAFDPVNQPGRRAFDLTRELLGSSVKPVLSLLENFESEPFDVVMYLGVLYHTMNPFAEVQKLASLCGDTLIVETHGTHIPGQEHVPLWEFFSDDQVNADKTTWWAPNEAGLKGMLGSAGFQDVEITWGAADQLSKQRLKTRQHIRIWAKATR